jgi:hypothetical protein
MTRRSLSGRRENLDLCLDAQISEIVAQTGSHRRSNLLSFGAKQGASYGTDVIGQNSAVV